MKSLSYVVILSLILWDGFLRSASTTIQTPHPTESRTDRSTRHLRQTNPSAVQEGEATRRTSGRPLGDGARRDVPNLICLDAEARQQGRVSRAAFSIDGGQTDGAAPSFQHSQSSHSTLFPSHFTPPRLSASQLSFCKSRRREHTHTHTLLHFKQKALSRFVLVSLPRIPPQRLRPAAINTEMLPCS